MTDLQMTDCKVTGSVPAGTFVNANGMLHIHLENNIISSFDTSNLKFMPSLETLQLTNNKMTELLDPYQFCPGSACENMTITVISNAIPCDAKLCWAKKSSNITLVRDNCLGKTWDAVTEGEMQCIGEYDLDFLILITFLMGISSYLMLISRG